jgi:dTDP-4-dehydrorhamnose reductase
MQKILITGSKGQLGTKLKQLCPIDLDVTYTDSQALDITDENAVLTFVSTLKPDVVINAAAYTAVDKAETDKDTAYAVNAAAVGYLAKACAQINARFIHISTDFIFDGSKTNAYLPTDSANPLSVYGESKYQGEQLLQQQLQDNFAIVRTSWVYSNHGNNFVKTMLRLMAEKPQLGIINDQFGAPTWAHNLAEICWKLAENNKVNGIFHYSDDAHISWFDFAQEIQKQGLEKGLLAEAIPVKGIGTVDYPTPATRPANSVMDSSELLNKLNISARDWKSSLSLMLDEFSQPTAICGQPSTDS